MIHLTSFETDICTLEMEMCGKYDFLQWLAVSRVVSLVIVVREGVGWQEEELFSVQCTCGRPGD